MTRTGPEASDRQAVAAATLAAALLIAQQVAARAVRDALFLSAFHVRSLPLVMAAAAVAALGGAHTLSFALTRRSPSRVVPAAAGLSAGLFLAWWAIGLESPRAAAIGLYLHVSAFGGALVSGFWSLVNERFDPYTARRVVGRIGTGATAGGVAGGLLAWLASRALSLPATVLVLVALGALAAAVLTEARGSDSHDGGGPSAPATSLAPTLLFRHHYLRDIALLVGLSAIVEAIVDFLFKAEAAGRFAAGASLLGAFAAFYTAMSVLSLLIQAGLGHTALRRLGIAGTLALRPGITAASTLLGTALPRFSTATLARGAHEALSNSLFRSAYELLYTPLPGPEKRRVKAVVDVAVDKAGAFLGSGAIALALALAPRIVGPVLFAAAAALSLVGLGLSRRLQQGYVQTLENSLLAGRLRLDPDDVVDPLTRVTLARTGLIERGALLREIERFRSNPTIVPADPVAGGSSADAGPTPELSPADALIGRLRAVNSGQADLVRQELQQDPEPGPAVVALLLPLLARDELFPHVLRALRRAAPRVTGQLVDALLDPDLDPVVRRRIPRVLKACPTPRSAEGLRRALDDPSFDVRAAAAAALAALHERSAPVDVPREEVLARVRRELDSGEPVNRQLPQLFALLSLTLERGPLLIAWAAAQGQDRALKGTALEYLSNVLPDDVFPRVRSVLGAASAPAPRLRRPVEQVAEELRASAVGLRIEQPPWREGGEG